MELFLEILGTIVGLLYLWLEYKASIYLWVANIIMPIIYIFVYYNAGLYADFGISVYYVFAAIYGWLVWRYGSKLSLRKKDKSLKCDLTITHLPIKYVPILTIIFLIAFILIAEILINFTDSNVPWLDSFTTALSIIGMWMLAKKHLEQWLIWIGVNIVSAGLYVYKDLYFTAGLYAFYAIIAILGYKKWHQIMLEEKKINYENYQ